MAEQTTQMSFQEMVQRVIQSIREMTTEDWIREVNEFEAELREADCMAAANAETPSSAMEEPSPGPQPAVPRAAPHRRRKSAA